MSELLSAHTDEEIIREATTAYYMAEGYQAMRVEYGQCRVRRDAARGVRVRLADAGGAAVALYQCSWRARRMRFSPALAASAPGLLQPAVRSGRT